MRKHLSRSLHNTVSKSTGHRVATRDIDHIVSFVIQGEGEPLAYQP
jgi:hypothetical protein